MKQVFTLLAAVLLTTSTFAQTGIGTTTPHASAQLEVSSTTKGLLIPRMTNAQRKAISNPAAGLQVFVTDFDGGTFLFYNGTGWKELLLTEARDTPDAPTIGTAVPFNQQATVSFTAPSSNGGSAITSYTATSSPGGITGTISQAGSGSITVTGLTNGVAYTFTVTAINAIGTSLASAVSNSLVPQPIVLGAPTIGTAVAGNQQATVSFTAPSSDGGSVITSYTAASSPGGITGTLSQSGSGSITVTGLTNGVAYTFTVTATNAIGTSLVSAVSNSVVPVGLLEVGDFYGGGVIFYLFEAGETGYVAGETHGLIAAVEDQSSGMEWYNGSYVITGATGTAIGTGAANTDAIIAAQGATETDYAAGLARAYTVGGYTDWFLPSNDELNLMYVNSAVINTTSVANSGSNFTNEYYWSSTERDSNIAWLQFFGNGVLYPGSKNFPNCSVRAVRAF
tara:strand:+ start:1123 stop:2478 length:1356 start_codon:yes stop_codon:yes gene_type:complete